MRPFADTDAWEQPHMTDSTSTGRKQPAEGTEPPSDAPDAIDEEAAEIDARSPDAPEQIEELIEHAAEEG